MVLHGLAINVENPRACWFLAPSHQQCRFRQAVAREKSTRLENQPGVNAAANSVSVSGLIGSAPQNASRQWLKSSAARSAAVVLRTINSYAKFGAPLKAACLIDINSSQRWGRLKKLVGAMRVVVAPT